MYNETSLKMMFLNRYVHKREMKQLLAVLMW